MPADLKTNNGYSNVSLIIAEDALVVLEHEMRSDRVRKIPHDRVEYLHVWRTLPVGWMVVIGVVLILPALALFFVREWAATIVGIFVGGCGAAIIAVFAYCRRTTIRLISDGTHYDFPTLSRPGKINRFVGKLRVAIEAAQRIAREKADAAAPIDAEIINDPLPETPPPSPDAVPPPPLPAGPDPATAAALRPRRSPRTFDGNQP